MNKHKPLIRILVLVLLAVLVVVIGRHTGLLEKLPTMRWNVQNIINAVLILLLLFIAEGVISYVLGLLKPKRNRTRTLISLGRNILRYAVILLAICVGLTIFNVDVVTILAGLGILALIIGFGAESLIADIVTGMFILIDNQYNVGDIIEVEGFRGTVTDISVRTTVLTDVGGNIKIINNSDMKNILNRSNNTSRAVADFPVPYGTDFAKLEEQIPTLLQSIHAAHPDVMKAVPVYLGIQTFADSAVVLRFVVEVAEADIFGAARLLNHDLLIGMRKLGVECPFPQVDVHTK